MAEEEKINICGNDGVTIISDVPLSAVPKRVGRIVALGFKAAPDGLSIDAPGREARFAFVKSLVPGANIVLPN